MKKVTRKDVAKAAGCSVDEVKTYAKKDEGENWSATCSVGEYNEVGHYHGYATSAWDAKSRVLEVTLDNVKAGALEPKAEAKPKKAKKAKGTKKAKKEKAPKLTRDEWLNSHNRVEGKNGDSYEANEAWLTNYEGSQEPNRPDTNPTHVGEERTWLVNLTASLMERDGWSSRQLHKASGVSMGQVAAVKAGKDVKASTLSRLLSAMGLDLS